MRTVLDLFCGAGMAADGYAKAGFKPTGVDIRPQPDYPYPFVQRDGMAVLRTGDVTGLTPMSDFDLIHASPPCQIFTRAKHLRDAQGGSSRSDDLLTPTLEALRAQDRPWVVENVEAARPAMQPQPGERLIRVCGSSFGLQVQRHRLFLSNLPLTGTLCDHRIFPRDPVTGRPRPWGVYHVAKDSIPKGGRTALSADHARVLFDMIRSLPWDLLKEGFPPAYTEFVGRQAKAILWGEEPKAVGLYQATLGI